ncbi:MAG: dolichyl-phosphate beta-glucosyltransferase [Candidatus Woesearchaeota archaeon]|jgi:glycosyltransferase involved in cell wall biosynthesis
MTEVSIVLPAYNEEKRLAKSLKKIVAYCNKNLSNYELIIVDDGSLDKTVEVAKKILKNKLVLLQNEKNMGKGYSVKRGILKAKYPFVLFLDVDLATPIDELGFALKEIKKGHDIVIASRNLKESKIITKQPKYRQLMGKAFAIMTRLLMGFKFKDTQCGFKLFKTNIAKKMVKYQTINRFAFDVELLCIAKKRKYSVVEMPVTWIDSRDSKVAILKDVTTMFLGLIKVKLNAVFGKYDEAIKN